MFQGFRTTFVDAGDAKIHTVYGGTGPALLLLHGYPQSHVAWHAVAASLQERFTLIIPSLRGYGDSIGPEPDNGHLGYSKRSMALDMVKVMQAFGHERFSLAGHDRGGRVAYRLALDHPGRVSRLAVLDILPTLDTRKHLDREFAIDGFHSLLLAQPRPVPETLIAPNPLFFLRLLLSRFAGKTATLDPRAVAEYERCFSKSSVLSATCEDYRAGATIDLMHDREDRQASRRIECPVLILRCTQYMPSSAVSTWRLWADNVEEVPIDCGHLIAEEQRPDARPLYDSSSQPKHNPKKWAPFLAANVISHHDSIEVGLPNSQRCSRLLAIDEEGDRHCRWRRRPRWSKSQHPALASI
jgi:haloacetate dehalogenase